MSEGATNMIDVVIIEDDVELREALVHILNSYPDLSCTEAYGSCEEVLPRIGALRPSIILMDIGLPGLSGIDCLGKIRELVPDATVVMLTNFDDDEAVFNSLANGAQGYILKRTPAEDIVQAIREVYAGGAPMSDRIARRVIEFFRLLPPASDVEMLSRREDEILGLLVKGFTYRDIADSLYISPETVRSHIKKIYEKLHVHSKAEAVVKYLRKRR